MKILKFGFKKKIVLISCLLLVVALPVSAQNIWDRTSGGGCNKSAAGCNFCDALVVTENVINYLFDISIAIAVLVMVWGAVKLMLAGGSEEKISSGKKTITTALIGLAVTLASWIIVNTLLQLLTGEPNLPWNKIICS